jgi:N2-acetyl-L-2,4-diaminobutanoate deacetylase
VKRRVELGDGHGLDVHEISGGVAGPVLAVLGGVHGDELEGVTAARLLLRHLTDAGPSGLRGTVRIVPTSNPPAFAARQRSSPADGANLARVFPGRPDGTVTQRIASVITEQVIAGADLLIDLHSAGAAYEMPVFAGYVVDAATRQRARDACLTFGAPVVWEHVGRNPGRSTSAAAALGVPSIYVEGSGGGGLIGSDLDIYVHGLLRVLHWLGMTDAGPGPAGPPALLTGGDGNTDASLPCSVAGFCVTRVRSGAPVAAGSLLADILDDDGHIAEQIRSPRDGVVMMLRRSAEVNPGDGIAMLGPLPAAGGQIEGREPARP